MLERLFTAPYNRRAAVLAGPELDEARAFASARDRARRARRPGGARRAPRARPPARGRCAAGAARHVGENPQPDRVQVARPEAIRARRFEAVLVLGLQEGEFPGGAARAVPARRNAPGDRDGQRPGAPDARGPARPRAVPLLRLRLARRAGAGAQLAHERRGGRAGRALVLPRRRALPALRCAHRHPVAGRRDLVPGGRAHGRGVGPGAGRTRPAAGGAAPRARRIGGAAGRACRARAGVGGRARALRGLPGEVARGGRAAAGGARAGRRAAGARRLRARRARAHLRPAPRRDRRAPRPAGEPRGRRADPAGGAALAACSASPSPRARRGCAPRCAGSSSTSCATWPRGRRRRRAGARARAALRQARRAGPGGDRGGRAGHRQHRPRGHLRRAALVVDYKTGKKVDSYRVAGWEKENRFQAALYMLAVEELTGKRAVGGRVRGPGRRGPATAGPARGGRGAARHRVRGSTTSFPTPSSRRSSTGPASGSARRPERCAGASCAARPRPARGTAAAPTRPSAGAPREAHRRAARGGRAPRRLAARARRGGHRQDDGAGGALRAGRGGRRRAGGVHARHHLHGQGRGRDADPGAPAPSGAGAARGGTGRRERLHLDHPRVLQPPPSRPRAARRASTRTSGCSRSWSPSASRWTPSTARWRTSSASRRTRTSPSTIRTVWRWWPLTPRTRCETWCVRPTRSCEAGASGAPPSRLRGSPSRRGSASGWSAAARAALAELSAGPTGVQVARGIERLQHCLGVLEGLAPDALAEPAVLGKLASRAAPRRSAPPCARSTGRRSWPSPSCAWPGASTWTASCFAGCSTSTPSATRRPKRERSALDFEDLQLLVRDLLVTDAGLREHYSPGTSTCSWTSSRT